MIKRVTSIVISFHLFFIVLLLFTPNRTPIKKTHHVKVHTVRPMTVSRKAARPPPQTSHKPLQTPKKTTIKPTPLAAVKQPAGAPKKIVSSKKPVVIEKEKVKAAPPKKKPPQAEVWNEIDQALAKIETKSYPKGKSSLEALQPLILDEPIEADESTESQLIGFLHDTLHLPEVGEVKIQLTMKKDGTISKMVVISAESRKNKLYLEEHLPRLQFPLLFDQEKTWTLTFYNEI